MSDFEPDEEWFLKAFASLQREFDNFNLWSEGVGHRIEEWHASARYRHPFLDTMFKHLIIDTFTTFRSAVNDPEDLPDDPVE